ncbi:hypothetical protein EDC01DRAFT_632359 [Geopyxis carbonaria]|nr:hypothetical protein EDC01DRAFT_632359 [Geopyxis carbonaria]
MSMNTTIPAAERDAACRAYSSPTPAPYTSVSVHSLLNDTAQPQVPLPATQRVLEIRPTSQQMTMLDGFTSESWDLAEDTAVDLGRASSSAAGITTSARPDEVMVAEHVETAEGIIDNSKPAPPRRPAVATSGPGTSGGKRCRVVVSEENKVALMKLCVENQGMHTRGKKKAFWALISALLEQDTGLVLRDPQTTHKIIVAARRAQLQREAKESGTVQEETELTQVVDSWLQKDADMEEEARLDKDPSAADKEAEEAEVVRQNLLLPRAQKRSPADAELSSPPRSARKSSRSPARSRNDNHEVFLKAMDKLGGSMQDAARVLASSRAQPAVIDVDHRLTQLEARLQNQADRHDAAQQQNTHMLTQIMDILQKQKN